MPQQISRCERCHNYRDEDYRFEIRGPLGLSTASERVGLFLWLCERCALTLERAALPREQGGDGIGGTHA